MTGYSSIEYEINPCLGTYLKPFDRAGTVDLKGRVGRSGFLNLTVDHGAEEAEARYHKRVAIATVSYRMLDLGGPLEWEV